MTQVVDRPHPQPLSQIGRGEKNVAHENLKIGIISVLRVSIDSQIVLITVKNSDETFSF
ncbi:hypothetical protein [Hydrococcus rivularis]|uniref:hypothetical protein n=1 Tax=Hydrococcus rivularis TaxID=1616834 RepID=UPI000B1B67D7|nr:hypothetical protein [Hydrococcus rivularis]